MRTLSAAMIAALTGQETGETFAFLVTIDHEDILSPDGPLRFSSDPTEAHSTDPYVRKTVSGGEDYYYVPMQLLVPDDTEDSPPVAEIRLSNVSRDAVALARSVTTPAAVTIALILASDPDTTIPLPVFDLVAVTYDADTMTLKLAIDSMASESYPGGRFTPASFPALGGY